MKYALGSSVLCFCLFLFVLLVLAGMLNIDLIESLSKLRMHLPSGPSMIDCMLFNSLLLQTKQFLKSDVYLCEFFFSTLFVLLSCGFGIVVAYLII